MARKLRVVLLAIGLSTICWFWYSSGTSPLSLEERIRLHFRPSSIDWSSVSDWYPVESIAALPSGTPQHFPPIQFDFTGQTPAVSPDVMKARQDEVRRVFLEDWQLYKRHAWGHDELKPLSLTHRDPFGRWGATLVDSLDTLWLMECYDDFYQATVFTGTIDWSQSLENKVNVFETTIRYLGGLLSAYELSKQTSLLTKAVELGEMLYKAFDTPNRMPPYWLSLEDVQTGNLRTGKIALAVIGSLSMEFTRLSQLTGNNKFYDATERITNFFHSTQNETKIPGLWPKMIDADKLSVNGETFLFGSEADSFYEYLPKMYLLLGGLDEKYKQMALGALDAGVENLLYRPMTPDQRDILFSGRARYSTDKILRFAEGDHLTCFVGGMYGLAGKVFSRQDYVSLSERLAAGCYWAYESFPTGVMPESFVLHSCPEGESVAPDFPPCAWENPMSALPTSRKARPPEGFKSVNDDRYMLRPEAIESIFYAYRLTGKAEYVDMAWRMFTAVEAATRVKRREGHAAILDVNVAVEEVDLMNYMESFWFSETLKYFYLIFSPPDFVSLDEWVFNTEAHPFRISRPSMKS